MADYSSLPPDVILFGPDGNCTLDICPIEASLYGYRPRMSASIAFIVLYALSACIHIYLGWLWKKWFFMCCMVLGALDAIAGYTGRIMLYNNPFDFTGFMLQISEMPRPPSSRCINGRSIRANALSLFAISLHHEHARLFHGSHLRLPRGHVRQSLHGSKLGNNFL